jgi:hypothetical protein
MAIRIQEAFLDAPALTLTPAETARRFGLEPSAAEAFLGALADVGVLIKDENGRYARLIAPRGFLSTLTIGGVPGSRRRHHAA